MSAFQQVFRPLLLSSVIALAACSSSDGDDDTTTTATGDGGDAAGTSTTFTIAVEAPDSLLDPQTASIWQKISNFVLPSAYALDGSDLAPENFAVTIVDTAGNVVEVVEVPAENIFQNPDGTWSIQLPGDPRLDCVIAVDVNGSPQVVVGSPLPSETLQAPTLSEDIDVDIASTVAFQSFIESLEDDGAGAGVSFADIDIDVDDTDELAAVEQLVLAVEAAVEELLEEGAVDASDFTSLETFFTEVESLVEEVIEQEIANLESSVTDTLADNLNGGGGLYWWWTDLEDDEIEIERGVVDASGETIFYYDLEQQDWVQEGSSDDLDDLILTADGWQNSADTFVIANIADDGSITLQDSLLASVQETVSSRQSINLAERSIMDFASTNVDFSELSFLFDQTASFSDGARAYRIEVVQAEERYSLWFEPGDANGGCPWSDETAQALGGNCEAAHVIDSGEDVFPVASLDALLSESAADRTAAVPQIKGLSVAWTDEGTVLAELVDNANKDVNYYLQSWDNSAGESSYELLASANWESRTPTGLPSGETLVVLVLPDSIMDAGDKDDDERVLVYGVHGGFVRPGTYDEAGATEDGITVYNQQANTDLLAALDFMNLSVLEVTGENACSFTGEWDDEAYDGLGGPVSRYTMATWTRVVELCSERLQYSGSGFTETLLADKSFTEGGETWAFNTNGSGNTDVDFSWAVSEGILTITYNNVAVEGDSETSYNINATEKFALVSEAEGVLEFRAFFQNELWQASSPGPVLDAAYGDIWDGGFEELTGQQESGQ
ncbi:hypothetical protein [Agaribacterium sp. ZY112]|uniref:hypothetical protein n=1 Tax=Agaribacterium sp. ZY112 TaxID=3233574 RepID=UPI0035254A8D